MAKNTQKKDLMNMKENTNVPNEVLDTLLGEEKGYYNEKADYAEVVGYGFVNLKECYINGAVPANLEADTNAFNGIESLDNIGDKPRDNFESYRMAREYADKAASSPEGE